MGCVCALPTFPQVLDKIAELATIRKFMFDAGLAISQIAHTNLPHNFLQRHHFGHVCGSSGLLHPKLVMLYVYDCHDHGDDVYMYKLLLNRKAAPDRKICVRACVFFFVP